MGNTKGRQVRRRTSNREAGVKPREPGVKADLPVANRGSENPMFISDLMPGSARKHLTLLNRRGTDPYARWCRRGGAVRRPPIRIARS